MLLSYFRIRSLSLSIALYRYVASSGNPETTRAGPEAPGASAPDRPTRARAALRGAASPPKLENAMDDRKDPDPNPDSRP